MSNLRFKVVEEAFHKKPVEVPSPAERPSEYFAKYVFNREKMFNISRARSTPSWSTLLTTELHWIAALPMKSLPE